jgi:hypothetical protein
LGCAEVRVKLSGYNLINAGYATVSALTGLLLGAGASQEYGMPVAWDISERLRREIPTNGLRLHNKDAQAVGRGVPDEILEEFIGLLARTEMSYESIIGYLEVNFLRNAAPGKPGRHYHTLVSILNDVIYKIFYQKHHQITRASASVLSYLDGIAKLGRRNLPLWIFSLNHDVVLECAAARIGMSVNSGFDAREALPLPNPLPGGATSIDVEVLTAAQIQKGLQFFQHGTSGINLIKLHGALDLFTVRDGTDIIKLIPTGDTPDGPIRSLVVANEVLPFRPPNGVQATNEIMYLDQAKEIQFLRRTILSGAFKYSARIDQVLPKGFMGVFQAMINYATNLVSIGYGFEDLHVNTVVRGWLEVASDRRLEIVDPSRKLVPPDLRHLSPQIVIKNAKAGEYLAGL